MNHCKFAVVFLLLCGLSSSSLWAQSNGQIPIFEPGKIQYGGQIGASWFVPSGIQRLEKHFPETGNQLFENVNGRYGTGIQIGGSFGLRLSRHFSVLQEVNLSRTNRTMQFNYVFYDDSTPTNSFHGKGSADVVSNYIQSFSAIQYSTLGQVALGVQLGFGVNGRLSDQVSGLVEPAGQPATYAHNWGYFPEVVEEALTVPFYTDLGAGFFVRFRMDNQEFKLTLRRNLYELGNLFYAEARGTYPRTSSLTLSWLIHQPKTAQ